MRIVEYYSFGESKVCEHKCKSIIFKLCYSADSLGTAAGETILSYTWNLRLTAMEIFSKILNITKDAEASDSI